MSDLPPTPHDRTLACLKDALALLANDPRPEADELCDRIFPLVEPDKCYAFGCDEPGTLLTYDRTLGRVIGLCPTHSAIVADNSNPEYHHTCENCGCVLPIN